MNTSPSLPRPVKPSRSNSPAPIRPRRRVAFRLAMRLPRCDLQSESARWLQTRAGAAGSNRFAVRGPGRRRARHNRWRPRQHRPRRARRRRGPAADAGAVVRTLRRRSEHVLLLLLHLTTPARPASPTPATSADWTMTTITIYQPSYGPHGEPLWSRMVAARRR